MAFRQLFDANDFENDDITKNWCIGMRITSGEAINAGAAVAISTVAVNKVVNCRANVADLRAYCGIALDAAADADVVIRVAIIGRVAAAKVDAATLKGDVVYTSTTGGIVDPASPAAAGSIGVGVALADAAAGFAPLWIGPGFTDA